ncbi:MAG: DUF4835 family protein [Ignavibacteria bacterium]|nr:DUF4835 family protein [Ignavibacteria bacterium]MBT8390993.1 DUF4835 family protein [Ignavibacteria bacterium]NNL22582.1 DUF4835 family protein [Ignavibacteriaceae bacterium]
MKKLFLFVIFLSAASFAQELNCRVDVNYENVPVRNRELLADFAGVIENYMNTNKFTDDTWDSKIDCALNIFFISASSDFEYSAQIVIVSQRPVYQSTTNSQILKINDGQWQFRYERGQALYAGQSTFDPLTSLLDYYTQIIIGFDYDTWEEFGGTKYFQRAQDIVNLGSTSGANFGWLSSSSSYNRWGLVNDILSEKYSTFRSSIFDYHYGIDIYNQNKELGQQKIAGLVNTLFDMYEKSGGINSVFVRTFFDSKHGEIIDYLLDYPDPTIFAKLKKIDPPHTAGYDAAIP